MLSFIIYDTIVAIVPRLHRRGTKSWDSSGGGAVHGRTGKYFRQWPPHTSSPYVWLIIRTHENAALYIDKISKRRDPAS